MADLLRHRQTKGAATDMVNLTPPRHIPTLPNGADPDGYCERQVWGKSCRSALHKTALFWSRLSRQLPATAGSGQPIQLHRASPMTRSRSRPLSHGNSSVNRVTHWRQEHDMRVMS